MGSSEVPHVGVVLVGHGETASNLLSAAQKILGEDALADVIAVDAGVGKTPALSAQMFESITQAEHGAGVLLMVDLLGASPCTCGMQEALGHKLAVLSGLNLAMLLKLATLDRNQLSPTALATACAETGVKSVRVSP